jgi:hypothetical protein
MEITKENMLAAMMRMCETNPYEFTERTHRNDNVETVILNTFYSERETIRLQLARLFESDRFKVHITENQNARRDDKDTQRGYSGYGGAAVYRSKGFRVDKLNLVVIESQVSFTVSLLDERYVKSRRLFPFCKKKYVETDAFKAFRELTHGDRFDSIEKYIGCDFVLRMYNSCAFTYRKYFVSTDYACEQITSKEYCDIERLVEESKQRKIEETLDKYAK